MEDGTSCETMAKTDQKDQAEPARAEAPMTPKMGVAGSCDTMAEQERNDKLAPAKVESSVTAVSVDVAAEQDQEDKLEPANLEAPEVAASQHDEPRGSDQELFISAP